MQHKNRAGYTIVEVMIVFAITGVIAVNAFVLVRGQQVKNQFSQAVRDFEVKLLDIANDVSKGYYPNAGTLTCFAPIGGPITFAGGTVEQGASNNCVFAGKVLGFNLDGNDERFAAFTLASRSVDRNSNEIIQFSSPPLQTGDIEFAPGLREDFDLLYGLRVRSIRGNGVDTGAIGFLSGFGTQTVGGNLTGSPETEPRWINTFPLNSTAAILATASRNPNNYRQRPTDVPANTNIVICLELGVDGRRARVELGRNGRLLSTTTRVALSDNAAENAALCT